MELNKQQQISLFHMLQWKKGKLWTSRRCLDQRLQDHVRRWPYIASSTPAITKGIQFPKVRFPPPFLNIQKYMQVHFWKSQLTVSITFTGSSFQTTANIIQESYSWTIHYWEEIWKRLNYKRQSTLPPPNLPQLRFATSSICTPSVVTFRCQPDVLETSLSIPLLEHTSFVNVRTGSGRQNKQNTVKKVISKC